MLKLEVKATGFEHLVKKLDPEKVKKAARMALNTAVRDTRSYASRKIREKYNVKAGLVGQAIKIRKAGKLTGYSPTMQAVVYASGAPLSLMLFNPKWYRGKRVVGVSSGQLLKRASKKSGVYVKIFKRKTTVLPHAFIASMRSGHLGVYQRRTKARLPIKERKVISIPSMLESEKILPAVELKGRFTFVKEYNRQIKRLLDAE